MPEPLGGGPFRHGRHDRRAWPCGSRGSRPVGDAGRHGCSEDHDRSDENGESAQRRWNSVARRLRMIAAAAGNDGRSGRRFGAVEEKPRRVPPRPSGYRAPREYLRCRHGGCWGCTPQSLKVSRSSLELSTASARVEQRHWRLTAGARRCSISCEGRRKPSRRTGMPGVLPTSQHLKGVDRARARATLT